MTSVVRAITKPIFGDPEAAAQQAASVQQGMADRGVAETRRQFDINQANMEPFREAELQALKQTQALTGLLGRNAQQEAISNISTGPGVDYQRERAEQALMRQASATGGLGGSRVQEALQAQAVGFAQQDMQSQLARLQGIGAGTSVNMANLGSGFARDVGNQYMQSGQAQASGILGAQQARSNFGRMAIGGLTAGLTGIPFGFGGSATTTVFR